MEVKRINKIYAKVVEENTKEFNAEVISPHILLGDYGVIVDINGLDYATPMISYPSTDSVLQTINNMAAFTYSVGKLPVKSYSFVFPSSMLIHLDEQQMEAILSEFVSNCMGHLMGQYLIGNFGITFSPFVDFMYDEKTGNNSPQLKTVISTSLIEEFKTMQHDEFIEFKKSFGI